MYFEKTIAAIDAHTAGEAARLIVSGIPKLKGQTVAEKKQYMQEQKDYLRTALMHEPRGHDNMFGAAFVEPTDSAADFGIIFMDGAGYLNMCGHNTIAAVTIAIETGMVEVSPEEGRHKKIVLDTPAGLVETDAHVQNGRVTSVSLRNVASFLYRQDLVIEIPELGLIHYDIAFGGSFFIMIDARQLPFKITAENASLFSKWGMLIRKQVNAAVQIQHPTLSHIKTADLVEFYEEDFSQSEVIKVKNVVVFGNGQIDRSPCGTGTCAKLATLYGKKQLQLQQTLVNESILGTLFYGKAAEAVTLSGDYQGIIPEIKGSAYITGINRFFIDDHDPLKYGFELK